MIKAGGTFFEEAGDDDDFAVAGDGGEGVGRGAGDRLGEFEEAVVLGLAEVLAGEEFLGADDLGALVGGSVDERELAVAVDEGVRVARHLGEADMDERIAGLSGGKVGGHGGVPLRGASSGAGASAVKSVARETSHPQPAASLPAG